MVYLERFIEIIILQANRCMLDRCGGAKQTIKNNLLAIILTLAIVHITSDNMYFLQPSKN